MMLRLSELKLPLEALPSPERVSSDASTEADLLTDHPIAALRTEAARLLGIEAGAIETLTVYKRSIDARGARLQAVYIVDVSLAPGCTLTPTQARHRWHHARPAPDMRFVPQGHAKRAPTRRPVVVGMGPCGLFAALLLAELGWQPLVLERGKPVRERTRDTWDLWRRHTLHAESNVQFGEGGAGTFSDGKLYSQIRDPQWLGRHVLTTLVEAGAPSEILWQAHPHIGTFRLVKVVEQLRARIQALGGEVRFEHKLEALELTPETDGHASVRGLLTRDQRTGTVETVQTGHVILALGHSARDTFAALWDQGVALIPKPFSVGARVEHPQSQIDAVRWGRHAGLTVLGAADYRLVHHAANGRGVYSFCMCPGGTVVAATSEPGRVVTNGMSQYSRQERNANAALVVGLDPTDFPRDATAFHHAFDAEAATRYQRQAQALWAQGQAHPLAGIALQRQLESAAYQAGGANYCAPAQLVGDFLQGCPSTAVGSVVPSYQPGVTWTDLTPLLPDYVVIALRQALPNFARSLRGFDRADAVLTGLETRTSSPLRLPRDEQTLQSLSTRGLYPAGEGAGYAGGILSAAVDGLRVAQALALELAAQT